MFVTSLAYGGDLGGLAGADVACDTHAANAGLPGTYSAWLGAAGIPAYSRIIDQSYSRVDGRPVADSVAHLRAANTMQLYHPINRNETNVLVSALQAWTGTLDDGSEFDAHCQSWTVGTGDAGAYGNPQATNATWTYDAGSAPGCEEQRPIYCFQSGPLAEGVTLMD